MERLCLGLIPVAFFLSLVATRLMRAAGVRAGALDSAPMAGQVKEAARQIPNTGGIAIFLGFALPILALLAFAATGSVEPGDPSLFPADLSVHQAGLKSKAGDAIVLLLGLLIVHLLGVIDDRRPLGPWPKLFVVASMALALVVLTRTRLMTMLDARAGGAWLSITLTVLWIVAITNALNFMDNMDGLAGSVACVASSLLLWTALQSQQWFIGACLALVVGATLGFLVFNFPFTRRGASIFMGDGGSLVLGFLLAFLSVRLTYASIPAEQTRWAGEPRDGAWYGVLMPLCALAVPIYDMLTVSVIRLRQGRSPFVGDLNHLSHRLVRRGLSRRAAVSLIALFTLITGLCGVLLLRVDERGALLAGSMVVLMMLALALIEFAGSSTGVQAPPVAPARGDRP
jgi:UDP-GlcNAc:undecaprenyl-phosphate GlcNAc-1-phosphate transferase